MPSAIDATPGGAAANAYCTRSEAAVYNDDHPQGGAWALATPDNRSRADHTSRYRIARWHPRRATFGTTAETLEDGV